MSKDNVVALKITDVFSNDPITDFVRNGAREILAEVLEAEISIFINQYNDLCDDLGRQRVVRRNSYLPLAGDSDRYWAGYGKGSPDS